MNRRGFQDDAPPWSFFLPVTLAVVIGILVADAVRLAIGAVFVRETAETRAPPRAPAPAAEAAEPAGTPAPAPASATATSSAPNAPVESDVPELPGPISAMRDRGETACINGTVADRKPNGWAQAIEDDAPLRCTATSP